MPGKLKDLHMGKDLNELKEMADKIPERIQKGHLPITNVVKSVQKVFKEAEVAKIDKDEEKSFVFYMKGLKIFFEHILKTKEYKKDEIYFRSMLEKEVKKASDIASELEKSLERRYGLLKEEKEVAVRDKRREEEQLKMDHVKRATTSQLRHDGINLDSPVISCHQLKNLFHESSRSFLILDCRAEEDFDASHIRSSRVLSVPDKYLKPGVTCNSLLRTLPEDDGFAFGRRSTVDLLFLMDWFTEDSPAPQSPLQNLYDAIVKWDPGTRYKCTHPMIVKGGYAEWLRTYPTYTTNGLVFPPPLHGITPVDHNDIVIEYPDLDTFRPPPETSPEEAPASLPPSKSPLQEVPSRTEPDVGLHRLHGGRVGMESQVLRPLAAPENAEVKQIVKKPPTVNRDLKPGKKMEERIEERGELLEKTREVLRLEKEWDQVRLRREKESEEAMRQELQRKEEQLIDRISSMESEKKSLEEKWETQAKENEELRKEMELWRSKATSLEEKREAEKEEEKFREQEELKKKMNAEVQRLRDERKAKDARMKKLQEEAEAEKQAKETHLVNGLGDVSHLNGSRESTPRIGSGESSRKAKLGESSPKTGLGESTPKARSGESSPKTGFGESTPKARSGESTHRTGLGNSSFKTGLGESTPRTGSGEQSLMKRSYSSPNVCKLEDSLPIEGRQAFVGGRPDTTPNVDRRLKPTVSQWSHSPSSSRHRNFDPIHGQRLPGLTGLKNLGNTCYMNAIVQCMSNTPLFASYFQQVYPREKLYPHASKSKGELAAEMEALLRVLWSGHHRCVASHDLRHVSGKYYHLFRGVNHQDAHEYLTYLFEWLREDLNRVPKECRKPTVQEFNGIDNETAAKKAWEAEIRAENSMIMEQFAGLQKSTVRCRACQTESKTFELFFYLPVPIPERSSSCSIDDCLQLYLQGEPVTGWMCPKCKEPRDAVKKFDLWKLPPILIIVLKRFYYVGPLRHKIQKPVFFPLSNLDMQDHLIRPKESDSYDLYAVTNHFGTLDGGHYTAYCKSAAKKQWFKFDDQEVRDMSSSDIVTPAAFILFFSREGLHNPSSFPYNS